MKAETIVGRVTSWFDEVGSASLKLPSGWFGRPYDNLYSLKRVTVTGSNIELSFSEGNLLSICGLEFVSAEPKRLSMGGEGRITWLRPHGEPAPLSEEFENGVVEFLVP